MALDAKTRSSIFTKLIPVLGEDDANTLMSQFPASEADELVTKQFLRAELAVLRGELRTEMAVQGGAFGEAMHQQTIRMAGALGAATAFLAALGLFT